MVYLNFKVLGEVMITQVSCLNTGGIAKDPRRTSRHVQFRNSPYATSNNSNISYKSTYNEEHERQQERAFRTSAAIVLGSIAFMFAYFVLSGMSSVKK